MRRFLLPVVVIAAAVGSAPASAAQDALREPAADLRLVSSQDAREELTAAGRGASDTAGGGPARAFLLSVTLPGAGQLTRGEKRGYAYIAAELALWVGFFTLNSKGLDERSAYEGYADEHWDFEGYSAWYAANCADCQNCGYECRPLAPYGSQEYYEDIGKYDTYWSWWSDSGSGSGAPEYLDVRNEYWDMRVESNRHLRQARYSLTAAFLNHIVSGVDAFLSARRSDAAAQAPRAGGAGSRLAVAVPALWFDAGADGDGLRCALTLTY
ncbi:MAG: hypothetical protein FJY74_00070 [Candidatus Eisenbacteria bacterium]|nr:hypothetical protein [Candidatus Eisenbacteria bacterium]